MKRLCILIACLATTFSCTTPLDNAFDVKGNFDVSYEDNLRVFFGDDLVAEVVAGEDATIEWDGQTIQVSQICGDEGTECPSETYWREIAVDQPWGAKYDLLNFVNLDQERGTPGQRMGGRLESNGDFAMLSGLALAADETCVVAGAGTVTGHFSDDAQSIEDVVIAYTFAGGCTFNNVFIGTTVRLETDAQATRTGDYDVSSVTPEEPIDEEGNTVDPEAPEGE